MAGSKEDTARGIAFPNNVAGSRSTQNPILSDQQFFDSVCSSDLGNQLHGFGVVVTPISPDNQEATIDALGNREQNTGNERFAVVVLLEDGNLLSKTRTLSSISTWVSSFLGI